MNDIFIRGKGLYKAVSSVITWMYTSLKYDLRVLCVVNFNCCALHEILISFNRIIFIVN